MANLIDEIVKYNQDYFPYEVADTYDDYSGGESLYADVQDMVENHPDELIDNLTEDINESNNPDQIADAEKLIIKLQKIMGSTTVRASSMFGETEGFFTRDDEIDYIEEPLMDQIPEIRDCRAYIDTNDRGQYELSVDIYTDDFEMTADALIDMRKIRRPADLGKYVPIIIEKYQAERDSWN